jgi:hypothetical protein
MRPILYQRDDCHLCDLALLAMAQAGLSEFDSVFIDGDGELESRFGVRVPVLSGLPADRELDWPFDAATIRAALSA